MFVRWGGVGWYDEGGDDDNDKAVLSFMWGIYEVDEVDVVFDLLKRIDKEKEL